MEFQFWMHGISSEDPTGCLEHLRDLGYSAVVLGADKENLAAAKELGLGAYACTGTFSRSQQFRDEGYLAVDVEGVPREWFGSTCPNREAVRNTNLRLIEGILTDTEAEGIFLDGCRFASPASGLGALFTCFCPTCQAKAKGMGYDFDRMKKQARYVYRRLADGRIGKSLADPHPFHLLSLLGELPGIADWMSFRAQCIIEHFTNVSDTVRGMGGKMAGYIFTPCLSSLVGQRYADLVSLLDIASPMIYRNYPDDPGPACINKETSALCGYLRQGGSSDARAAAVVTQFLGLSEQGKSISDIDQGVSLETIRLELERTGQLLRGGPKLVPILYLGDEQVEKSVKDAKDLGLDGVDFFVYKDEWSGAVERAPQCLDSHEAAE
jgi:hypothetical protein